MQVTRLNKLSQLKSDNATVQHLSEMMLFLSFFISPGSAEERVRGGEKIKYLLIVCCLSNISATNYENLFMGVRVIARQSSDFIWTQCRYRPCVNPSWYLDTQSYPTSYLTCTTAFIENLRWRRPLS